MQFFTMNPVLIEINKIKNIDSISLYYLQDTIPALIVTYDNGKVLNLCAQDKYFIQFVRKVLEVYKDEKGNEYANPFGVSKLTIDENTKSFIENGYLENINELYNFYLGKCSYDSSLLFQIDEVSMLIPMLKYHLKTFFDKTDYTVTFDDSLSGYRNSYIMNAKVDGLDKNIRVSYDKTRDNEYEFKICGILSGSKSLLTRIKFRRNKIEVEINIPEYDMYGCFTYIPENNLVKSITEFTHKNLPIFYENKDLESSEEELDKYEVDGIDNYNWYKLPWGASYGVSNESQELNEYDRVIVNHTIFVDSNKLGFNKKENYSKVFYKRIANGINSSEIVTSEIIKNINCVSLGNGYYVIETEFLDGRGKDGYYDEELNEKYFYHVVKTDNLENINSDELVSVTNEDVLDKSDFLSHQTMLKLVKGDNK